MRQKKMKKGYIFLIDGIFAVILLVIGLIIISSNRTERPSEINLATALDNSVSILSSVKVSEICDECDCSIKKLSKLCLAGNIKNREESLLDYAGELYSRGDIVNASALLENISMEKKIFREKEIFDVEIRVNNVNLYPMSPTNEHNKSKENTNNLLSTRRIIFGYYETPETGEIIYWGPYELEVELWEKP